MMVSGFGDGSDKVVNLYSWPEGLAYDMSQVFDADGWVDAVEAEPLGLPVKVSEKWITGIVTGSVESNAGTWSEGQTPGTELDMVLVVSMSHHRYKYAAIVACNDYTGWGCMGDYVRVRVASTIEDLAAYGLSAEERRRLGYDTS